MVVMVVFVALWLGGLIKAILLRTDVSKEKRWREFLI